MDNKYQLWQKAGRYYVKLPGGHAKEFNNLQAALKYAQKGGK